MARMVRWSAKTCLRARVDPGLFNAQRFGLMGPSVCFDFWKGGGLDLAEN